MLGQMLYLADVAHVIAVASGKGGVGKTTVAVNLALALARDGARVGLFDADLYGPNVPLMLGVHRRESAKGMVPVYRADPTPYIQPLERFGLKVMSMGFVIGDDDTVTSSPLIAGRVIRQTLQDVVWGELDFLLLDLPPGTGEPQQTLLRTVHLDGVLIVTTPQDLSLMDAGRSLGQFREARVPVLGVIENMSYLTCPHCGKPVQVFHRSKREWTIEDRQVPLLGRVPMDLAISRGIDAGHPLMQAAPDSPEAIGSMPTAMVFRDIAARVEEIVGGDSQRARALRQGLVEELKRKGHVRTPPVEAAFRAVPRHLFVPGVSPQEVYSDRVFPAKVDSDGKWLSSSSQPAIMAIMLEQLGLEPGHKVLEIGAGTGYNAALMAHIVGEGGQVVTIDIEEDLVQAARANLARAGLDRVQVICGDGGYGHPDAALYDRMILTVGVSDIVPAWIEQLKPGGRLVLPLAIAGRSQQSFAFERIDDHLASLSAYECGFISLRGAFDAAAADTEQAVDLGPEPGLTIETGQAHLVDAEKVFAWLTGFSADLETGVEIRMAELPALEMWLALRELHVHMLVAQDEMADRSIVPPLVVRQEPRLVATGVLVGQDGLAALARPPAGQPAKGDRHAPFGLWVRQFGPDAAPASRLLQQVKEWDAAGRPSSASLRVRAYPRGRSCAPAAGEFVVEKEWTVFVLDWPARRAGATGARGVPG